VPSVRTVFALFTLLVALSVINCGHACNLVGCSRGLTISLYGDVAPGSYTVDVAVVTPLPEVVRLMTCSVSVVQPNQWRMSCSSSLQHAEFGTYVVIDDFLKNVLVTVSAGDRKLTEQRFEPVYEAREVWGPGCGTCTAAAIHVLLPST
jgi:hypothetical protein